MAKRPCPSMKFISLMRTLKAEGKSVFGSLGWGGIRAIMRMLNVRFNKVEDGKVYLFLDNSYQQMMLCFASVEAFEEFTEGCNSFVSRLNGEDIPKCIREAFKE